MTGEMNLTNPLESQAVPMYIRLLVDTFVTGTGVV